MQIELVTPAERHRETFLRGLRELQHEGLPWYLGADVADVEHDFPGICLAVAPRPLATS